MPLPQPRTAEELAAVRAAPDSLSALVRGVAERHGLGGQDVLAASRGSFPVFFVGSHGVVKLVPETWRPKLDAERAMLERLARVRLSVPVPELLAAGAIEGWSYLVVSRLEGVPLAEAFDTLGAGEQRTIVRALGALMAEVHEVPFEPSYPLATDWPAFVDAQRGSAVARHSKDAPAAWVDAIPGFLEASSPRTSGFRPALMSADITNEHVLVRRDGDGVELSGFFDFGDALVGDPAYDFVTPGVFIVRGRADLFTALLDGYGVEPRERTPELRAKLMTYELLHRFSNLARDAGILEAPRALATLEDVERALFPIA